MSGSFGLSPNNNSGFNFKKFQTPKVNQTSEQTQQAKAEKSPNNPFDIDALFSFKKPDIVYDKVMKSSEMLNFLRAQKLAGQFLDLTKPEHQVGKRLNFEI